MFAELNVRYIFLFYIRSVLVKLKVATIACSLIILFYFLASSLVQQRAELNWCWLLPTFLCGPVITQPLSSVSLSGVFLLNNLIYMTQITVRGRLTNSCICHCHSLLLMEKHLLPNVSYLLSRRLRGDLPCRSEYVLKKRLQTPSVSSFQQNIMKSFVAPPGGCGLSFQVLNVSQ